MTCGLEVQTTKADAIQPKKDECSISSPGMVTSLGSDGFVEFTPTQPNIDVTIKDCLLLPSFGFSIFIYPQVSTGTIAHYVATSASVSEFSDFLLTLTNGMLEVTLNIGSEVFSSGAIGVLNINSWNLVVFGFDGAVKKLHLSKHGGSRNQMKNDLGGPLSVPGVLRIGSKQGTSAPERFTGRVACAMLFDEKIEYSQANQAIISFCNSPWENVPSPGKVLLAFIIFT
ncbi:hypothetical protein SNE40_003382 [Patella caerulea]|uniref:Uncharacterized protein n=1 Tax=Patella caerulea TaxID=87958 RepID=A0AAN8KE58_PATCE